MSLHRNLSVYNFSRGEYHTPPNMWNAYTAEIRQITESMSNKITKVISYPNVDVDHTISPSGFEALSPIITLNK